MNDFFRLYLDNNSILNLITESTKNHGSTPIKFRVSKKYTEKMSSSYSTEYGWKLQVSTTISTGELTSAVVNFETTITAGTHGTYITDRRADKTAETTYERVFEVTKLC